MPATTALALLLKLERLDEALICFTQAIALKPAYIEALTNRGTTLSRLHRHEEASADFRASDEVSAMRSRKAGTISAALCASSRAMKMRFRATTER